jgi:hypothetical protein
MALFGYDAIHFWPECQDVRKTDCGAKLLLMFHRSGNASAHDALKAVTNKVTYCYREEDLKGTL